MTFFFIFTLLIFLFSAPNNTKGPVIHTLMHVDLLVSNFVGG